jgi:hypothetical protein
MNEVFIVLLTYLLLDIIDSKHFNEIQSLVVDCYASSFQLRCWPCLLHLRILGLKDIRDFVDVFNFMQQHEIIVIVNVFH